MKKTFKIEIEETLTKIIAVEAETEEEAIEKVRKAYAEENRIVILSPDQYTGDTKFNVVPDDCIEDDKI